MVNCLHLRLLALTAVLLTGLWNSGANAYGIVINAKEIGPNVVFSYSGSLNVGVLGTPYAEMGSAFAFPWYGGISITSSVTPPFRDAYSFGPNGSLVLGPGSIWSADSFSGDSFRITAYPGTPPSPGFTTVPEYSLSVPGNYNGGLLAGSMTFLNNDFTLMGMTIGTYSTDTGGGIVTLNVGPTAVPLPSSMQVFGLSLVAAGLIARRRQKRRQAAEGGE